jgi:hypothetical protein
MASVIDFIAFKGEEGCRCVLLGRDLSDGPSD